VNENERSRKNKGKMEIKMALKRREKGCIKSKIRCTVGRVKNVIFREGLSFLD
jgi:hypothetical protein